MERRGIVYLPLYTLRAFVPGFGARGAKGHIPFASHRNVAEAQGCSLCGDLEACREAFCPKRRRA